MQVRRGKYPGKQEKIFPPKHPYYKAPEEVKKSLDLENKRREENRKEYERLKKDPHYRDVEYDAKSGGVKGTHKGHAVHSAEKEQLFFQEKLTSTQLEKKCQEILYRLGNSAILCEEGIQRTPDKADPALDLLYNGKKMDIASITNNDTIIRNVLHHKSRQIKKYNSLDYVQEPADSVCLYFHDPSMFSKEKILKAVEEYKNFSFIDKETGERKFPTKRINKIYCVINNNEGLLEEFYVE